MLIGLGYKARSGKDTVADFLEKRCGFSQVAFADALKEACAKVFGLNNKQLYGNEKEVPDDYWGVTPREILQKVGTECFRHGYADDIWIRALKKRINNRIHRGRDVVVTDVRFPNEAEAIKSWGGIVVRVDREGAGASGGVQNHASEVSLDGWDKWDHVLLNDGTLGQLEEATVKMAALLGVYSAKPDPQLSLPLT